MRRPERARYIFSQRVERSIGGPYYMGRPKRKTSLRDAALCHLHLWRPELGKTPTMAGDWDQPLLG